MTPESNPFRFKSEWERLAWNHRFSAHDTLVLQYLIFMANTGDGDNCYPSVRRISAYTRLSERAVQRSLSSLEVQCVIVRNKRIGYTNLYEFCDPSGFTTELVEFDARRYPGHTTRPVADGGCQPVTSDCVAGEGCHTVTRGVTDSRRGGDSQAPYHNHIPESETRIRDQEAAATHTREGERACEASQPAAAPDSGDGKQGLSSWLLDALKARKRDLVKTNAQTQPAAVRACAEAVARLAGGDEDRAQRYVEDRLTGFVLRGEKRPQTISVLLGFLVDRADWQKWDIDDKALSAAPKARKPDPRDPFTRDPREGKPSKPSWEQESRMPDPTPPPAPSPEDMARNAEMLASLGFDIPATPKPRKRGLSWLGDENNAILAGKGGEGVNYDD